MVGSRLKRALGLEAKISVKRALDLDLQQIRRKKRKKLSRKRKRKLKRFLAGF